MAYRLESGGRDRRSPDNADITATATDPAGNTSEFSEYAGPHDHLFADTFDVAGCG